MSTRSSGFAGMHRFARTASVVGALTASLAACSLGSESGTPVAATPPFGGAVVADEPQAAQIGKRILAQGGSAADAAAAMGFALSVTLPSRASLGGGGACLAYDPSPKSPLAGEPEAILFSPGTPAKPGSADRPAAVTMMARGLYLLQARYGTMRPAQVIKPAEDAARAGTTVSPALARDLAVVAGPLSGDPAVRAVFFAGERPLAAGAALVQPELADTLAAIRQSGVADLAQGSLARKFVADMARAGGGVSLDDLAKSAPTLDRAWLLQKGSGDFLALLPAAERGSAAVAVAAESLIDTPKDIDAAYQRALSVAAAAREGDPANATLLKGAVAPGKLGALPASTTFAAVDAAGRAVVCATSLDNLFGTGRMAQSTGILLAASPARAASPLLSMAIEFGRSETGFLALSGGSGQEGAPMAAAFGLNAGVNGKLPAQPPEPGRANVIACPDGLAGGGQSCVWSADPRDAGAAVGVN